MLITKLKKRDERLAYAASAVEHGWSRKLLTHHIELGTVERTGKAITNFAERLPKAGLRAPSTSHEILEILETAGHLPAGTAKRYGPMFGFRDRIVHLYDRVDPRRVHEIVRDETGDLAELGRLHAEVLARLAASAAP